jgi:hypothetical protein
VFRNSGEQLKGQSIANVAPPTMPGCQLVHIVPENPNRGL